LAACRRACAAAGSDRTLTLEDRIFVTAANSDPSADLVLHRRIEAFFIAEAALLDEWRLDDWLRLFTPDCRYVVPTMDLPDGRADRDLMFIDDGFVQLQGRVERLKSRHAYREYPSSRTRRIISNVRVLANHNDEIHVAANFVLYRFRSGTIEPFVGSYVYHLTDADGVLRIRLRRATLDNESMGDQGVVSVIL